MDDSASWGPWIEHDGAVPVGLPKSCRINLRFFERGILPSPDKTYDINLPNFYWRWQRVRTGWFSSKLRRVCDDPAYAPIIAYRIARPRGLTMLTEIAAKPDAPLPSDAPQIERV